MQHGAWLAERSEDQSCGEDAATDATRRRVSRETSEGRMESLDAGLSVVTAQAFLRRFTTVNSDIGISVWKEERL